MITKISGIAASNGIAFAKAFRLEDPEMVVEKSKVSDSDAELTRFQLALNRAKEELEIIRDKTIQQISKDEAAIFNAHLLLLSDPELLDPVTVQIKTESVNAEFAIQEISTSFIGIFESMGNEYMKERASDIRDVTKRLLSHLLGIPIKSLSMIS